jgi:nicotinate-nucleotide pyrophosphorylase (carboxylating)
MTVQLTESEWDNLHQLIYQAKDEDLGTGDITGKLLPADLKVHGKFVAREPLVVCGGVMLERILHAYDDMTEVALLTEEGQFIQAGEVIAECVGLAWAVMAGERVALNFLQHLSGIATLTRQYVDAVAQTNAAIYDTRKTTPGWRELEKYAVRAGGGENHRRGLYDAILIKDNHLAALARAGQASALSEIGPRLNKLRRKLGPGGFVEVEVDTLDQLSQALTLPVDVILLDNMNIEQLHQAVAWRDKANLAGKVALEASGGITLKTVGAVAKAGVERVAVGAITHSAKAVDIGLDMHLEDEEPKH